MDMRILLLSLLLLGAAVRDRCAAQEMPRVLWIILGGGVRTDDLLASERFPAVGRLVSRGVSTTQMRVENLEAGAPVRTLLTGSVPAPSSPWTAPTLAEVLRKERGLPADAVWLVSSGAREAGRLAVSSHPEYGASFSPAVLAPDLVVTRDLVQFLRAGNPAGGVRAPSPLSDLFDSRSGGDFRSRSLHAAADFLLGEAAAAPRGPGDSDARALRAARRILEEVDPVLLTVLLSDSSISARRHEDGLKVLDLIDRELGSLMDFIEGDPERSSRTSIILAVDHGRNEKLDGESLPASDDSRSVTRTLLVCTGPAFKSGESLRSAVRQADVAPTIARIFDLRLRTSDGRPWRQAFP